MDRSSRQDSKLAIQTSAPRVLKIRFARSARSARSALPPPRSHCRRLAQATLTGDQPRRATPSRAAGLGSRRRPAHPPGLAGHGSEGRRTRLVAQVTAEPLLLEATLGQPGSYLFHMQAGSRRPECCALCARHANLNIYVFPL